MDDFLQKPVMLDQLKNVLQKWLVEKPQRNTVGVVRIPGPNKFQQTREQLAELEKRIHELRHRSGL
jgi:23S rRNA C2498 (ribose-2'-O)-methylase RlmM